MWWKLGELFADLFQCKSNPLREHDERDSPQDFPGVASLAGSFAFRADQSFLFVEPECRSGDPAPFSDFADVE